MALNPTARHDLDDLAIVGDPDGRLLTALHEDDLEQIRAGCLQLIEQLRRDGYPGAAWFVTLTLRVAIENEGVKRRNGERELRLLIDANGHGVNVDQDVVEADLGEPSWHAYCEACWTLGEEGFQTEADARAVAQAHIDQTGGSWESWEDDQ